MDAVFLVFDILLVAKPVQISVKRHECLAFMARELEWCNQFRC